MLVMSFKAILGAIVVCILIPSMGLADDSTSTLGFQIEFESVQDAIDRLSGDEELTVEMSEGWLVFQKRKAGVRIIWLFTSKEHFAFPSLIKTILTSESGAVNSHSFILCEASVADCEKLAANVN